MEATLTGYVGMTDLMQAVRTETSRIREASHGDVMRESEMLLDKLISAQLITDDEAHTLSRLYRLSYEAGAGKGDAHKAYFETRAVNDTLLASGKASSLALILVGTAVGSYNVSEGPDGSPVITVYKQTYTHVGAAAGALIGLLAGGAAGAGIGGLIGGAIGGLIDDKHAK